MTGAASERRDHHRYNLGLLQFWGFQADGQPVIRDVSAGGISLYTEKAREPGTLMTFRSGARRVVAEVLDCAAVPADAVRQLGGRYLLRLRFDEVQDEDQLGHLVAE